MTIFSLPDFTALPLPDEEKKVLAKRSKELSLNKGDSVFRQGEVNNELYLIRSGLVKLCYLSIDGKEFIKSFIPDGGMFGSLYSQLTGEGSTFSAVALEPLQLKSIPFSYFQELVTRYPAMQQLALSFFQQLALKKEMREYEFLCLSANQRYEKYCQQQPDLVKRIKQADLALYLGITPIALSRMKHRSKTVTDK